MAKSTNKKSFSKAILSKESGKYIITEITKDDTKDYDLSKVLDEYIGVEGVNLTIGVDDEIQPIDDE